MKLLPLILSSILTLGIGLALGISLAPTIKPIVTGTAAVSPDATAPLPATANATPLAPSMDQPWA